jgi:hypothetical protein
MRRLSSLFLVPAAWFCALIPVSAQAGSEAVSDAELHELAAFMMSDFATSPENLEQAIVDRRIAIIVDSEPGVWFYSQMNTGNEQRLYRQRFHQLTLSADGQTIVQRSFTPIDPTKFADGWDNPEVFEALGPADMRSAMSSGCEQSWRLGADGVWRGTVDPETCLIFSERRQASIRIGADSFYRGATFGTSERGFDQAMNPIWGSKPGEYIPLTRCRSHLCAAESQSLMQRAE